MYNAVLRCQSMRKVSLLFGGDGGIEVSERPAGRTGRPPGGLQTGGTQLANTLHNGYIRSIYGHRPFTVRFVNSRVPAVTHKPLQTPAVT